MATNWVEGVLQRSHAKLGDRLVLLTLAESANRDTGESYPGIKTLCRLTLMSERAVQASLKRLIDAGELSIQYNASRYQTNLYTIAPHLNSNITPAESAPPQNLHPPQDLREDPRNICTPPPAESAPKPLVEPSVRTVSTRTAKKKLDGFAEWYAIYPRKEGRAAAEKAWAKLGAEDRLAAMEALPRHVPIFATRQIDKVPHPSTWLNGRRWEDQIAVPIPLHQPTRMDDYDPELYGTW